MGISAWEGEGKVIQLRGELREEIEEIIAVVEIFGPTWNFHFTNLACSRLPFTGSQ